MDSLVKNIRKVGLSLDSMLIAYQVVELIIIQRFKSWSRYLPKIINSIVCEINLVHFGSY